MAREQGGPEDPTLYLWENHVHILPPLGDLRVDRITAQIVEESLRNTLLRQGRLAPQPINKVLGTLTSIFDYAERHGTVERNPARLAERLRVGTAQVAVAAEHGQPAGREVDPDEVPSPDDVRRLLFAAEPGLFKTYAMTAALTGARSGELLALIWDDVDFEAGEIHIRRTVTWPEP
jgi:integrase